MFQFTVSSKTLMWPSDALVDAMYKHARQEFFNSLVQKDADFWRRRMALLSRGVK